LVPRRRQIDSLTAGRRLPAVNCGLLTVNPKKVQPRIPNPLCIDDAPKLAAGAHFTGVADLAAHLRVEWRGVEDNGGLVLDGDYLKDLGGRLEPVVADELGRGIRLDLGQFDDLLFLSGPGSRALPVHQLVET